LGFRRHHRQLVTDFFCNEVVVFYRGFLKNRLQQMVFLWSDRGAMRGNRGSVTVDLGPRGNLQKFELYLRPGAEIGPYSLPMPHAALN
jgi:hypothetical protein